MLWFHIFVQGVYFRILRRREVVFLGEADCSVEEDLSEEGLLGNMNWLHEQMHRGTVSGKLWGLSFEAVFTL